MKSSAPIVDLSKPAPIDAEVRIKPAPGKQRRVIKKRYARSRGRHNRIIWQRLAVTERLKPL
jgi:hypothetical protein